MNCRGLIMVNLFAFVSTKPSVLKKNSAPIGPDNNAWIVKSAQSSDIVIPAWGNHGNFLNRDNQVMRLLEDYKLFCFGKNKNGSPKHPLYVLGGKAIERFST